MSSLSDETFLEEAARMLGDDIPPNNTTLPAAGGKTPTTDESQVELATAVDGGSGVIYADSMPSQRIHVVPPPCR